MVIEGTEQWAGSMGDRREGKSQGRGCPRHLRTEVRGGYPLLALKRDRPAPRILEREKQVGDEWRGDHIALEHLLYAECFACVTSLIGINPEASVMLLPYHRCGD